MDAGQRPPRLLVGLGNPGRRYADTRHNIGFMLADALAADAGERFVSEKRWQADVARDGELFILKPLTFMNDSGVAVGRVASFFKILPEEVLVMYDDMDLPLGRLRIRPAGSAGGHNGMKSIIAHLGTQDFPRLRLGIGRRESGGVGHVLGKFASEERSELEKCLEKALLAVRLIAAEGLSAAMTRFNAPVQPEQKPGKPPTADDKQAETTSD